MHTQNRVSLLYPGVKHLYCITTVHQKVCSTRSMAQVSMLDTPQSPKQSNCQQHFKNKYFISLCGPNVRSRKSMYDEYSEHKKSESQKLTQIWLIVIRKAVSYEKSKVRQTGLHPALDKSKEDIFKQYYEQITDDINGM